MRADRLLSILLLLQANGRMTASTLAKRLEVSERTILRDMDALSGAGVPVTAERGAGGGWRLIDGYQTKLTGLTATEIQTLFLGRPPKVLADLGLKEAAEGAWIKLQAALPSEVRAQAEFVRQRILIDPRGWRDSGESIACLPMVLEALWRGRQLRFVYERSSDGGERLVTPLGLVARASAWYLVADKGDQRRTYRVSRIREAAVLDAPCARPAGFDLASHWERASSEFREKLPRQDATFLASAEVMPWIRYRAWRFQGEEAADGGRFLVRLRFDVEEEIVQFALALGAAVELVEPA
ncbi:MAG TPA: YafY family protein, partial [Gammaproteobacteria bacterium]|nr:YafY family protein [Gammaproteobacteria bacterium]